ncbi:MAG: CHAD domain-containing protein, partial [Candidatus Omnitrophica bacterium]|nr:CHAD domain-containing protein [Candidatus Omnitrophota bacterium]
ATVKKYNRLFQRVAREASAVRDLDVFLIFLNEYKRKMRSERQRQSLRELIADIRQKREGLQHGMSKALKKYAARLQPAVVTAVLRRRMSIADQDVTQTMMDIFQQRVEKSVTHLLAYNVIVPYPEKKQALHEMRIRAKHLRYTLEGIKPYFDTRIQLYIGRALFFHKILGEIHDFDVWMEMLDHYRPEHKLNSDMGNTLNVLYNYLKRVRAIRYRMFVQQWHHALKNRQFEDMLEFVYAHH